MHVRVSCFRGNYAYYCEYMSLLGDNTCLFYGTILMELAFKSAGPEHKLQLIVKVKVKEKKKKKKNCKLSSKLAAAFSWAV